jgi:hypothetical protein
MRHAVGVALILVWGTTCAPQAAAEDLYFGVLGGANFSTIVFTPDLEFDVDGGTSPIGGAFLGLDLGESLSVETRVMFVRSSGDIDASADRLRATGEAQVDYLSVPLLVRVRLPGHAVAPFLVAGPELGFKTGAQLRATVNGLTEDDPEFDENIASRHYSLNIGGGLEIPAGKITVILEGLYSHGLNDIDEGRDVEEAKIRGFRLTAGLRF